MLAIARHENGSILFCSRDEKPEFERFFEHHRILEQHYWNLVAQPVSLRRRP